MKTREFKLRKSIHGRIMILFLVVFALIYTGCSKDDEVTTYTVTFDADGGSPVPSVQSVEAGNTVTAPATNPAKTGYVFLFWHMNGASTAYNFSTPVNSNITLQAKWEEESKVEYWQVSWDLNGGAWPTSGDNHATQVVKGGTLAEPAVPVKSGNTFDGWYKEVALSNKISFPYDVSSVTSNFTLYAKWTKEGGSTDPSGYKMFTSIAELRSWLIVQPNNTVETAYKVALKNVNLDSGNNWGDLGLALNGYVDLNLQNCSGTTIPDGYQERVNVGVGEWELRTYGAFTGRSSLVAITLPIGLKTIGKWAFYKCSNLNSVTLPVGLININDYAFDECKSLASIVLPNSLENLGYKSFQFSGLTSISLPGTIKAWSGFCFYRCESLKSITASEGLKSIGYYAFQYCTSLESINLPQSLELIGEGAFSNCGSLETVILPKGVTTIDEKAFYGSTALKSVVLSEELSVINKDAFSECMALKSITIPAKVKTIGESAFGSYCAVATFIMNPIVPPTLGNNAISSRNSNDLTIKVPNASLNAYKTANGWSIYASKIVANTD